MDVLEKRPLSFQELSRLVQEDDEQLSRDIDYLVHAGVVSMRFRDHHVMYTLAHHPGAVRLMRKLEETVK